MTVNFRVVKHTLALIVLISLADIALFLALLLKPFNEGWSWSIACETAEWFWSYMQRHWEESSNAKEGLVITGDELPEGESAVIISNHLSYGDYYLVQALATRQKMLGKCRYFVKKEIVWQIPLFGWAFWALGMILVSREWTNDSRLIEDAFFRIKENGHDCWIVIYPEGTRRTPKKILQAQAFARQNGKNELKRLLYPRAKGFQATIKGLRGSHIQYAYDLTFQYTSPGGDFERVPSLDDQLAHRDIAQAGYKFRIHVDRSSSGSNILPSHGHPFTAAILATVTETRIPIADLPSDDSALKEWLENRWVSKDQLLAEWADAHSGEIEKNHKPTRSKRKDSLSLGEFIDNHTGTKQNGRGMELSSRPIKTE